MEQVRLIHVLQFMFTLRRKNRMQSLTTKQQKLWIGTKQRFL